VTKKGACPRCADCGDAQTEAFHSILSVPPHSAPARLAQSRRGILLTDLILATAHDPRPSDRF
jgi:hypothetical protein